MEEHNNSIPSPDKNKNIAELNYQRYRRARDNGHRDFVEKKKKCVDFYVGNQWDEAIRKKLETEGRPALTINKILSTVNTVLGEQISRRASFQAKVKKNATAEQATVVGKTLMHVAETNDLENVESEVFRDGIIGGRGYFDVRMDFAGNINGEISIKHKNPEEVLLSPDDNEYDPSSWREVITSAWQSLDEIEVMYSRKKMLEVKEVASLGTYYNDDSIVFDGSKGDDFGHDGGGGQYEDLDPAENKDIKSVRVISRQYKKMKMCRYFVDQKTGDTRIIPDSWSEKRVGFTIEAFDLAQFTQTEAAIRWTTTADQVVLKDDWSPYRSFTIIPYFCYWVPGRPFGMVENLISPQEQLNKVSSQELHIVNSTANSGWVYEDGSIANHTDDEMASEGSKTGLIVTYRRGKEKPEKITPNSIPTGLDRVAINSSENIKEISGVSDALLGTESAEVSGVALKSKENRGQVQIQVPLDHLARTRKILGHKILELVQDFYTEERVMYITDHAQIGQPRTKMEINTITPVGAILNDVTLGEYDIVVTTQPARDAWADSQFAELLEMRGADIPIPAYRIVEQSHLANKDEIAKEVQQMEGLGQKSEEEQQIQQMQTQAMLQSMQLELQKMSAEIQKLGSETVLNEAKANDLATSDQMELAQAQIDLQKEREGNELRRDLATLSAVSSLDKQVLSTKGKIAEAKVNARLSPKDVTPKATPKPKPKDGKK